MDEVHNLLLSELPHAFASDNIDDDALEELFSTAFNDALANLKDKFGQDLASRERAMLAERRAIQRGFVSRNVRRWKKGFDKLERLIVMSEETGSLIAKALGSDARLINCPKYESIVSSHARAVLVCREILCLMINGFPDGALGRWRTLHEIAVVAAFISDHPDVIAERYVAHAKLTSHRRAQNYMRHHERAKLSPIDNETMSELSADAAMVIEHFGPDMKHDYGWAAPAFFNKTRPTFADIEASLNLDHWRPRYKWATMETHSAHLPHGGLGLSESIVPVRLVGPSNSGMTDPGHMAAISLNLATWAVVKLDPNLDRLAVFQIMMGLVDDIGEALWAVQSKATP